MDKDVLNKFKEYFQKIELNKTSDLYKIYDDQVVFRDPIHEIHGLSALAEYFEKLNHNLKEGSFEFTSESIIENTAYLTWEMSLMLKKPNKEVKASGISVIIIKDKIIQQRDYFDAGELFYEHIPVLGSFIRLFKKKIAQ